MVRRIGTLVLGMVVIGCGISTVGYADYSWQTYNGHQYALTNDFGTWEQCEVEAVGAGGHLVNINDEAENIWLTVFAENTFVRNEPMPVTIPTNGNLAWIGYFESSNDIWEWVCGDEVTYTNLSDNWSNYTGTHAYLHGGNHPQPETWSHNPLHESYDTNIRGIIEVVPEPAMLSVLVLGGLAMLRRRRM